MAPSRGSRLQGVSDCFLEYCSQRGKGFCLEWCLAPNKCSANTCWMQRPVSPCPASFSSGSSGSKLGGLTSRCFPVCQEQGICHEWLCDWNPSELQLPSRKERPLLRKMLFVLCDSRNHLGGRGSYHQCCLLPTDFEEGTPVGRSKPAKGSPTIQESPIL